MTKSICIIGAGPSGLVTAKTLLSSTPTPHITLYDRQSTPGGLWPASPTDHSHLIDPRLNTNISRYSQVFSDFSWPGDTPEFPKAWQVGEYLGRYAKALQTVGKEHVEVVMGAEVIGVQQRKDMGWSVTVRLVGQGQPVTREFDRLIVAGGFFSEPYMPTSLPATPSIPTLHSTAYRGLPSLFPSTGPMPTAGTILVIGAQLSGVETAAQVALDISSFKHCPGTDNRQCALKVLHVVEKPTWIFPPFLPDGSQRAPRFLPMDLKVGYRRKNLDVNLAGSVTEDAARQTHARYQELLGSDQGDIHESLRVPEEVKGDPAQLAISAYYANFVRDGAIAIYPGRFQSLNGTTVHLTTGTLSDITAVIFATGFTASPVLFLLSSEILTTLSYDPMARHVPVALAMHSTYHPEISNLGFIGFYRSPYWGVMEMQARFLAKLWANGGPDDVLATTLREDTSLKHAKGLQKDPRRSQFPMGDAQYIVSSFSKALGLQPISTASPLPIATPSLYVTPGSPARDANAIIRAATEKAVENSLNGKKNLAAAIFYHLLGKWRLERSLRSKLPSHPSGHFSGIATFSIRHGTEHGWPQDGQIPDVENGDDDEGNKSDEGEAEILAGKSTQPSRRTQERRLDFMTEYVYNETGTFTADNGLSFQASRNYIWRYDAVTDVLSVWFVAVKDVLQADYLFHEVVFAEENGRWKGSAGHLCVKDYYNVYYDFGLAGAEMPEWKIIYGVKGPDKDYRLCGRYTRDWQAVACGV